MKSASQALINHLRDNKEFRIADVYTVELKSGLRIYHTSIDVDVVAGGITYKAGTPFFSRTATRLTVGVEVDEMTVTVAFKPTDTIGSAFWRDVARVGVLDGATIKVERAYFTDWTLPALGVIHVFEGGVGEIQSGMNEVNITVKSATELFNTMLPRSLYQASCRNLLFDTATCGVNKAAYTTTATVSGVNNKANFTASTGKPPGWFSSGYLVFTSGANAGLSASIKAFDGTTFVLNAPLLFTPAVNDGFIVYAGCDRLLATCKNKFNNGNNFRGEPFTPKPEAML